MKSYSQFTENELLSQLANGDIQAFDELYWKYQKAVYQNVYKLTRDAIIAEDIVQEVFISLWEKRSTIDINRTVAGWLFVSSYNRSINALKKQLKETLLYKNLIQHDEEPAYDHAIAEMQLNLLEKAVSELSAQKRRVFELCKLQGKSYEEAAIEMKISKHTVKEYLSEAVNSIRAFASMHSGLGVDVAVILAATSLHAV